MRQRLAVTIPVTAQKQGPARPDGVGHVAPRPDRSYRIGPPPSRPQAGARLALRRRGLLGRSFPGPLHLDPSDPDLHGPALGMVWRSDADRAVRHSPQDRDPGTRTRRTDRPDLPGVPQDAAGLD